MMKEGLRLLICTNGSDLSGPALTYGVALAEQLSLPVLILGIIERPGNRSIVEKQVDETQKWLNEIGIESHAQFEDGPGIRVVPRMTRERNFLSVLGPFGRPVWQRFFRGRSFRQLLASVETPMLYVRKNYRPIRRVLLCMGGLGYARGIELMTLYICKKVEAEITLLHIVEPGSLNYPISREVQEHWKNILQTDTPQGRNLGQAIVEIKDAGLNTNFKVRHGSPIREILSEIEDQEYDLIGLGSAYSTQNLRHLYIPNVTAEVVEATELPVLTARKTVLFDFSA